MAEAKETLPPGKYKILIDSLVDKDRDVRRRNRRALGASLSTARINAERPETLKSEFQAFCDAGWALIGQAEYSDGEYTLAAAISVLVSAIRRRSELKAWLPLVINDQLKRFMNFPVADLDDAAWHELTGAIEEGEGFGTS